MAVHRVYIWFWNEVQYATVVVKFGKKSNESYITNT